MVSLWPWRAHDTSPASFEKALSTLATKIATTQAQLDRTRSTARRVKVLWTLYLTFAYLVYAIVLVLVVGWGKLGTWEWTGIAGGPVLIYSTRTLLGAFFNFRIESLGSRLKEQQGKRAKTIQKLKDATKYDSTQELLKKYGDQEAQQLKGEKPDSEGGAGSGGRGGKAGARRASGRTNMPPPPTANIPRGEAKSPASGPGTPVPSVPSPAPQRPAERLQPRAEPAADLSPFGPGASPLGTTAQYAPVPATAAGPQWYDRFIDLLLGEDETAAKNRIVLICSSCRLVNGQAPPGTKTLSDVGMWKCMACGVTNGEVDEGKRIVKEVLGAGKRAKSVAAREDATDGDSSDVIEEEKEDGNASEIGPGDEGHADREATPVGKNKKGKGKGKGQ